MERYIPNLVEALGGADIYPCWCTSRYEASSGRPDSLPDKGVGISNIRGSYACWHTGVRANDVNGNAHDKPPFLEPAGIRLLVEIMVLVIAIDTFRVIAKKIMSHLTGHKEAGIVLR